MYKLFPHKSCLRVCPCFIIFSLHFGFSLLLTCYNSALAFLILKAAGMVTKWHNLLNISGKIGPVLGFFVRCFQTLTTSGSGRKNRKKQPFWTIVLMSMMERLFPSSGVQRILCLIIFISPWSLQKLVQALFVCKSWHCYCSWEGNFNCTDVFYLKTQKHEKASPLSARDFCDLSFTVRTARAK